MPRKDGKNNYSYKTRSFPSFSSSLSSSFFLPRCLCSHTEAFPHFLLSFTNFTKFKRFIIPHTWCNDRLEGRQGSFCLLKVPSLYFETVIGERLCIYTQCVCVCVCASELLRLVPLPCSTVTGWQLLATEQTKHLNPLSASALCNLLLRHQGPITMTINVNAPLVLYVHPGMLTAQPGLF